MLLGHKVAASPHCGGVDAVHSPTATQLPSTPLFVAGPTALAVEATVAKRSVVVLIMSNDDDGRSRAPGFDG